MDTPPPRRCSRCFAPTGSYTYGLCVPCRLHYGGVIHEIICHADEDARYREKHPELFIEEKT